MDFAPILGLRAPMDEDKIELIRQLYTRAGMALEDASVIAVTLGGPLSMFDPAKVAKLDALAQQSSDLLKAARSLHQ